MGFSTRSVRFLFLSGAAVLLFACASRPADDLSPPDQPKTYEQKLLEKYSRHNDLCGARHALLVKSPALDGEARVDAKLRIDVIEKIMGWRLAEEPYCSEWGWETKDVYSIDKLKITLMGKKTHLCETGSPLQLIIRGEIGEDSSFAVDKLLDRLEPCIKYDGSSEPIIVVLESGGGSLEDGYILGKKFREHGVTSIVKEGSVCASACAFAYLGGKRRIVEGDGVLMLHSPYFRKRNKSGGSSIDCEIPAKKLRELRDYYLLMVGEGSGDRLYERTMNYCSEDDGWVVSGGAAAELFGLATEK